MATAVIDSRGSLFFQELARRREGLLIIGYDGVIAPFSGDRHSALPIANVRELIDAIASTTRTEVVIVGGRPAVEIRDLLRLCPTPEIWGCNGLEHISPTGGLSRSSVPLRVRDALAEVAECLEHEGVDGCLELKHGAVAVHWRELPVHLAREVQAIATRVFAASQKPALITRPFDGGLEIRYREATKYSVMHSIIARSKPGTSMAYLGGMLDDEEVFAFFRDKGLPVLVTPEDRTTSADLRLAGPEELTNFLFHWLCAAEGNTRYE
jgi:trehalose 6-phosphate synthase/trehalose 6-phosphate phosphatase